MPVEIISKKTHPYAGKNRKTGDSYIASKEHAKVLVGLGFAEYAPEKKPAPVAVKKPVYESASMTADADKPKREYKRRDLTVEEGKG